ncbi:MAG TPA: tyrosine-type recombinase/integrase [Chthoniobacterales bacterium]|jgi:site-specific recombinase XerD|nr:tyrosine-type recombinase/integrase [Chthoniobacterales bacterium]
MQETDLGTLVQAFFCKRLISQRRASPHTIASYRDTFRLLLAFAQKRLSRPPSQLELKDISPSLVSDFLDHLEATRRNRARTRNLRLTAIRSFFRFTALEAPEHGGVIQRVLAIPNKRCQRPLIGFLTRLEIEALLAVVDCRTWIGRRDYALLLVAMQTGLRLSELTALRRKDVSLGPGAHIHCVGKGRKERGTPLTKLARRVLQAWIKEPWPNESAFLFPSFSGGRLSADAVQDLVNKHVAAARLKCPSLVKKRVTPHVLRHTAAMELLQAGVDRSMIALWLGHESVETTQIYLDANLELKQEILAKTNPVNGKPGRYRPTDRLLSFLNSL